MKRPAIGSLIVGREVLVLFVILLAVKLPLLTGAVDLFDAVAIELDPVLRGDLPVSTAFVQGSPAEDPQARWRPLATASLRSDLALGAGSMLAVRFGNLLLHLGLLLALYRLLRRFGPGAAAAGATVALMALHPIQVPVIATIEGRSPLLGLLAFLIAAEFMTRTETGRRDRIAAFVFAGLGALAAPGTAPLAALPLVAAWAHREAWCFGLKRSAPALLATGIVLVGCLVLFGRLGMAPEGYQVFAPDFGSRIAAGLGLIGGPLTAQFFSPSAVSPDPAAPDVASFGGLALVGLLVLTASVLLAIRERSRGRGLGALGFAMLPLLLLPATPICWNGPLPGPAEALPALLMMAFPIAGLLARPRLEPRPRLRLIPGLLFLGLAIFSIQRCWPWHDPELLLQSLPGEGPLTAIDRAEGEAARANSPVEARTIEREVIEKALDRFPREPRLLQERLRIELRPAGRPALALDYLAGLAGKPPRWPGIQGLLGSLAAATGDMNDSRAHWQAGLADPHDALSRFWLAQEAQRSGDAIQAKRLFMSALEITRAPADQGLAVRVLLQLDYLRQRGEVEPANLAALVRRQRLYAPRAEDRKVLDRLLASLEG